jgi:hypothetical protein
VAALPSEFGRQGGRPNEEVAPVHRPVKAHLACRGANSLLLALRRGNSEVECGRLLAICPVVARTEVSADVHTLSDSIPLPAQEAAVQRNGGASRRDRGSATLELALLLPVLLSVAFGIIDFSRVFNAEIQLSQAAREGVRLASLVASTNTAAYTSQQVTDRVRQAAPAPGFSGQSQVQVDLVQLCPNTTAAQPVAMVRVTFAFRGVIWRQNLTEEAVMRCAG